MAEQTSSSAPASGIEQPAPVAAPPKKDKKKKLWLMIVALIVAALLIGTALFVFVMGGEDKELTATITPDPVEVSAGDSVVVAVAAELDGDSLTGVVGVTYDWSVDPSDLGEFNLVAQRQVTFTAGDEAGTGTISCVVEYEESTVTAEVEITVAAPYLASVVVQPASAELAPDEEGTFNATAYDSIGAQMSGVTFAWAVEGLSVGEYTLSSATGASVTFNASVEGTAWLNASATVSGHSASGSAAINVTTVIPIRSVDYYWYDMFEVPFEDYWLNRSWSVGGTEEIISEDPYLFVWKSGAQNTWTYTNMRLNVAAENITEISTTGNPWFIPLLNDTIRGGHAYADFYMDYGTYDELLEGYGDVVANQCDGWLTVIKGTVTMDEIASMSMFNMTSEDFDDFDIWWAENGAAKTVWYQEWLSRQGNVVYDVFNAYEYPLVFLYWPEVMQAEKVGDEVVLHYDYVTWGMEVLFTRWLRHSFMNTEWYFEDFHLKADIGPERADVDVTTVVEYAAYAYETTEEGRPCWMWEALLQDILPISKKHPVSDYEPYDGLEYLNTAPGSLLYGEWMPYDYAPGVQNLSEGERLTLAWPGDDDIVFQVHVEPGVYENITGPMTLDYSEPMWTDPEVGDQVLLDSVNRTLTFVGPLDLWTWSKDQTTHENLVNEWTRLGLLPYGAPTLEFRYDAPSEMDSFLVENYSSPVMEGVSSAFDVIAQDEVNAYYPDYIGTIEILTNDSTAVITQSTFAITDLMNGMITIPNGTVTFNTPGTFAVTIRDTIDNTLVGSQLVEVAPAPSLDHFVVELSAAGDVIAFETPVDATVTAYTQSGTIYTDYLGTVAFTSSDFLADLPADYEFQAVDAGTHTFVGEILFWLEGDQTVWVNDTLDETKNGVSDPITVLPMAIPTYILLTGISTTPVIDIPETVTATVYDQYDRVVEWYDGEVTFSTNRTGEVTLPADYTFDPLTDLGIHTWTDEVVFTALGLFTVSCTDAFWGISGEITDIEVVLTPPVIDHFVVEGIESMWEGNYSDVTVTAWNDYGKVFSTYEGTVHFTTDATGAYELPADYTFTLADAGVHTFLAAVMFEEAGTFSVTVEDTVVPTATGTQTDIVIGGAPRADSFVLESDDSTVPVDSLFSVTLTVYDQYDQVYDGYLGTVHFSSTDAGAILPPDYTFVVGDAGVHTFPDELSLSAAGTWTITVTDTVDSSLTDSTDVTATEGGWQEIDLTVYDMFGQSWGEWWQLRTDFYTSDWVLNSATGQNTMVFRPLRTKSSPEKYQQIIYAPYRMSVDANNVSDIKTDTPLFMPRFGPAGVTGADAVFDVYFEYLYQAWWDSYWIPTWGSESDFEDTFYPGASDGYYVGVVYNVTMNREAAYALLNMPTGDNPATWWTANGDTYTTNWMSWVENQGDVAYDIYCGYEWDYAPFYTWADLTDLGGGQVKLSIGHLVWGYDVLMTRWLSASGLCEHENWWEDFQLDATLDEAQSNITADGVVQYQLHAVKQNASAGTEGAWVFEATNIDYITQAGHASDYELYENLMYASWNAADAMANGPLGEPVPYEAAAGELDLAEHMSLTLQLPTGSSIIGYDGAGMTFAESDALWKTGDQSAFDDMEHTGTMDLGFHTLDLSTGAGSWSYDGGTKTLVLTGPLDFSSTWVRPDGTSYHGAPWIEFDVDWTKLASTPAEPASMAVGTESVAGTSSEMSTTSEVVSLVSVMCAVMLVTAALALGIGRRRDF